MLKLIVVSVFIPVIVFLWKKRKLFQISSKLQHDIKTYPLVGVSYLFFGNSEDHMTAIIKTGRETIKRGGLIAAWFGPRLYISIADPVTAEIVLKTCLEKDDITRFTRFATGNGSVFAPVPIWRHRRKILTPSFAPKNLVHFVQTFVKHSEVMINQLQSKADGNPISMWTYLYTYAVDSVCETALGIELNTQVNHEVPFLRALAEGTSLIAARTCQPWLHSDLVYKLLPSYRKLRKAVDYTQNIVSQVIKSKRKEINQMQNTSCTEPKYTPKTLLELLLQPPSGLSDLELQEEMLTFMVAGVDTTALCTGFTLLMLGRYPSVQNKVYLELNEVFGGTNRSLIAEDLYKLKYLEVVIKETLRLYPPGVVALRKIDKDITLPSDVILPNGCGAVINIWALHRNPSYWGADAEEFYPERFLNTSLKHPAQYMPFSFGPRNCIGYKYAMMSMKTALATILRGYRVLPTKATTNSKVDVPLRLKFDFLLKDADNFTIRLEKR